MPTSAAVAWSAALLVCVVATAAAPRATRGWAGRSTALLLLYLIAVVVARALLPHEWELWAGAAAAAAVLVTVQPFIALGVLRPEELGLCPPQRGRGRTAGAVIFVAVALHLLVWRWLGRIDIEMTTTALAAIAVIAIFEELVFRGVLLALFDRALPPQWSVFGAPIGWGGIALTASFIALHGLRAGMLLGIVPAALLYLWLRAYTGSLLAPIAAHLAWNLSFVLIR